MTGINASSTEVPSAFSATDVAVKDRFTGSIFRLPEGRVDRNAPAPFSIS
ncbi:hypothetical protein [Arthrobacter yangruifuii]|nr:hypothetical protein [Arthrobacter yangruifuii]